jgi:glycosyltransferase involved in cell wall biosynthesis
VKVLQINVSVNTGSTGVMAEDIGLDLMESNGESHIAFGRDSKLSKSKTYKIGNKIDQAFHLLKTRLYDLHGLSSKKATNDLCEYIRKESFDLIHLHNLHGYYIHFEYLMNTLKEEQTPVVWTFHDCWPFTGHCAYFEQVKCIKWHSECHSCPLKSKYPANLGMDKSRRNFRRKKQAFTALDNLTIVPVSHWLGRLVRKSFFTNGKIHIIQNGVDIDIYKPTMNSELLKNLGILRPYLLGVSNIWSDRKGLCDIIEMRDRLSKDYDIVLVGMNKKQISSLPKGIIGIHRTENRKDLASLYTHAEVFINPSLMESFGLVTVEAMACGTPAVVYNATASPELVSADTGHVVEVGDIEGLVSKSLKVISDTKEKYNCRDHVVKNFNRKIQNRKYIDLYTAILNKNLNEG